MLTFTGMVGGGETGLIDFTKCFAMENAVRLRSDLNKKPYDYPERKITESKHPIWKITARNRRPNDRISSEVYSGRSMGIPNVT